VDYRPLNEITKKNAAPIPLIPDLIDKLLGTQFFTKLDIQWGYNNIRIHPDDIEKTTFKTLLGLFESLVMTFGLCNAPATFQIFMDKFLCYAFGMVCEQSHIKVPLARFAHFAHKLAFSTLMWLCSQTICLSAYYKNLLGAVPPNPCCYTLTNSYLT
jgi:Reverse transcriptase (RNA-dependent DNA polymerase)